MNPHDRRRSIFRIAILLILAIAYSAWHLRSELSWWRAKPTRALPSAAFVNQSHLLMSDAARQRFEAPLDEPLMLGPTFADAIDKLSRASGASFFVNWQAIAKFMNSQTPMAIGVGGETLVSAITKLLRAADPTHDRLGFSVNVAKRCEITISSRDDLTKNVATRAYDVRDLIINLPNATDAPYFSMSQSKGKGSLLDTGGGSGKRDGDLSRTESVDKLIERIQNLVAAETWKDRGGQIGSIRELAGQLIITQTYDNQKLIEYELAWLRWRNQTVVTARKALPILVPVMIGIITLELLLALRRSRFALREGLCPGCGYDLRASLERCPECGRPTDRVSASASVPLPPGEVR